MIASSTPAAARGDTVSERSTAARGCTGSTSIAKSLDRAAKPLRARAREVSSFGVMLHGNTFRLPFADASFDHVICSEVMEHVHDYPAACRELARVTRPGGHFAVTIPTATSEALYLRLGDDYFESPGGHIRIFRPLELASALAAAGLATTGVGFAHALHTPYWALARR